jgi:hypothetical protein
MYFDLDDVFGVVNFEAVEIDGYRNVGCIFLHSETESSFMGLEFWKRASCLGKRDLDQSPRPDWVKYHKPHVPGEFCNSASRAVLLSIAKNRNARNGMDPRFQI